MQIDFDPAKDAANLAKHGVSLAEAEHFEWDTAYVWLDDRFDYDEVRMAGWGYIGLRLFHIVFVDREDDLVEEIVRRIISLRKATPLEMKRYASS